MRHQSRRRFLQGMAGLGVIGAGLALLAGCSRLGAQVAPAVGEPPPETTTLRMFAGGSTCQAPRFVAEDLLRSEGFADLQYLPLNITGTQGLAEGKVDLGADFAPMLIRRVDVGDPLTILGGMHVGCFELFGTDQVRSIRDLKGRTVAVSGVGFPPHVFLSSMAAYVGLDPSNDINFVVHPSAEAIRLLADGKIDAYMGFPPEPQQLRAASIGNVVVNSSQDRPWSQYFCCMIAGNREFVQKNPIATRRATRAILKAADVCASQPELAARTVVERGLINNYDYALQTMNEVYYGRWREYDAEDTIRFYSLRLQEVGMIKSTPDRIISQGTNWKFFTEIKQELKA